MAKVSKAAVKRLDGKREALEEKLKKYKQMVVDLRESDESRLVKTKKQKQMHTEIRKLQTELDHLGK